MVWVVASGSGAFAQTSGPPVLSTDEIIAKHIAARGGLEALHAIHTLRMTGSLRISGLDAQVAYEEDIARPASVRIDVTLQGLTAVQAYDGKTGWQIQPFQGRKDPETLSSDDAKSLQEEADFEDPLIDAKDKGAVIENLGVQQVDGGPAYALRVTLKNGDQQTYYLDPDAWLAFRVETRQILRGSEQVSVTDLGDYEKVAGVYFPFEVTSGPKGQPPQQTISYAKIEANPALDPAIFQPPAGAKTGGPAPAAGENKK
jgi:hypothetical protein